MYLPTTELFNFLRIRIDTLSDANVLTGYLLDESRTYRIDAVERTITFDGDDHQLDSMGIVHPDGRIYLRSDLYGAIFGLHCTFDFRGLEVRLQSDVDLPALRDMKREHARRLAASYLVSTPVQRIVPTVFGMASPGVLDWEIDGDVVSPERRNVSYSLAFGGELLGGSFEARLRGNRDSLDDWRMIPWRWNYVDNSFAPVRQVTAGSIVSPLPSAIGGSTFGVSATNKATVRSSTFGTYAIADRTEPLWDVELYVDGRLIDYTTADSNGMFRFDLPIRYGANAVRLKFYGPWGEERTMERDIRIPHNFLPAGTVEYTGTAGLLHGNTWDSSRPFASANAQIGLGSLLSLGGGGFVVGGQGGVVRPSVTSSLRLGDRLMISADYTPTFSASGALTWAIGSRATLDASVIDQQATAWTQRRTRCNLDVSAGLELGPVRGGLQLHGSAERTLAGDAASAEGALATHLFGVPLVVGARGEWVGSGRLRPVQLTNEARITLNPFSFVQIRAGAEYSWIARRISSLSLEFGRTIVPGLRFDASVRRDLITPMTIAQCGLQFDLPFARTSLTARRENDVLTSTAGASGSVRFDDENGMLLATPNSGVNRASLALRAFLDLNNDGRYDEGEPLVPDIDVGLGGGTVRYGHDSLVRVLDLDPNVPYLLTIDDTHLPNISWRARHRVMQVTAGADHFQRIDIPIVVAGEASGQVLRERNGAAQGIAGIIVRFRSEDDGQFLPDSVVSIDGGEFFYMGLPPGRWTAVPDPEQMKGLGLALAANTETFAMRGGEDGDVAEGISIRLR